MTIGITSIKPLPSGRWIAHISPEPSNTTFVGNDPNEARAIAQAYCDKLNYSLPPEGYVFMNDPGVIDSDGVALAWDTNSGEFELIYVEEVRGIGLAKGTHWIGPRKVKL